MIIDLEKIKEISRDRYVLKGKTGKIKRKDLAYIPRKNNKKTQKALEEIEECRNHSWYEEIYNRNKDRLDSTALIYRGSEITFSEMFDSMEKLARSLKEYGIKKGDEIPICLGNTPELIYLMGAASMLGVKINVFGPKFDSEYITQILNDTHSSIIFVEDNHYGKIKESIDNSNIEDIVMISLSDSLKKGIHELDEGKNNEAFTSKVEEYKKANSNIKSFASFMNLGKNYTGSVKENVGLDDEFSITYSSGSTNTKYPKQIVHNNRSFITIARYHDPDTVGGIDMSRFTIEALLPTYSNTDLISCISDSLMQGSTLALEPIGNKEFFINSLMINQPNYIVATTSYWIQAVKEALYNPDYQDVTMPYLVFAFAAGEGMSVNEERFLNKGMRKLRAGSKFLPRSVKSIAMSAAGGDCEHGGIFYTLFRRISERKTGPNYREEAGLKLMDFAELAVLDKDGSYCSRGEYGRVVANSGCSMEYYKNNPEATEKFFIKDAYGKTWGDCSIYGFVDKKNKIHIKGRIRNENEMDFPPFLINDEVLRDQYNILSAVTVHVVDNDEDYYVVHYEKMPESTKDSREIMEEALIRIKDAFGEEKASQILFREHSFDESFAVNNSGKRDIVACQEEGISEKTIHVNLEKDLQKTLKK